MKEFFKKEWSLFLNDMQAWGEVVLSIFEKKPLMLNEAKDELPKNESVFKNEWNLFKEDITNMNKSLSNFFGFKPKNVFEENTENIGYVKDEVDYKVETYFGEPVEEIMENACEDKTQHEVLREYASFFKPYNDSPEMCQTAFRKYYDKHALKIAVNDFPIEQARIIQNNVDIFIKGQEEFGEGSQFIDSRIDNVFEKAGIEKVNDLISILSDTVSDGKNLQGERIFSEAVSNMIDNGIKYDKKDDLMNPIKKSLEMKLDEVHSSLKQHDGWNEEYQALISQERKYLYALNRIEQYETEKKISEFEMKLNELDVIV